MVALIYFIGATITFVLAIIGCLWWKDLSPGLYALHGLQYDPTDGIMCIIAAAWWPLIAVVLFIVGICVLIKYLIQGVKNKSPI